MARTQPTAARAMTRMVVALWSLVLLLSIVGITLFFLNRGTPVPASWGSDAGTRDDLWTLFSQLQSGLTMSLLPALLGPLILLRFPRHRIGWLLYLLGLTAGALLALEELTIYANFTAPGRVPGALWIAWLLSLLWIGLFVLTFGAVALFPGGRLPSRRWRWVLWLIAAFGVLMVAFEINEDPMSSAFFLDNPLGPIVEAEWLSSGLLALSLSVLIVAVLGVTVLSIVRFRHASGAEREQHKWLAWSLLMAALLGIAGVVLSFGLDWTWGEIMVEWSFVVPLLAMGLAILRYRLYDIDVIINRTLVYASLTATLTVVYFSVVVILQQLVRAFTGQRSQLAIVASTLTIAALFQPLRRGIQSTIDRRLYRRKYDAAQTLVAFSTRIRDQVELNRITTDLLTVVEETIEPEHVWLWLNPEPTRRPPRADPTGKPDQPLP